MFSFVNKKGHRRRDAKTAAARRPRLERRDALKNIDYEASWTSASSDESPSLQTSRSLDFSPASYSTQSSFRIGGSIEGEVEHLYRSLGLSGPEDFAIPIAAWEASLKVRSSSDVLSCSRWSETLGETSDRAVAGADLVGGSGDLEGVVVLEEVRVGDGESAEGEIAVLGETMPAVSDRSLIREGIRDGVREEIGNREEEEEGISRPSASRIGRGNGGVKGTRPPVLIPPPPVSVLAPPPVRSVLPLPPSRAIPVHDRASTTWEIVKSFAPADEDEVLDVRRSLESDDEDDGSDGIGGGGEVLEAAAMEGEMSDGAVSFSTSIDDDSSSTTTEIVISPNGRFKKKIRSWMRGGQLGSGSFGTVYEGISDDGTFIAVKEVSLLDKGKNAEQCILQLEQEIALLSQFEHENIVQYYGTDKEESKLYIFLELVTQGSIASLYQKYHLRDTQVSSYTRQILNGLNYLHERDVVHRDIKCANILVHANGSIKLADFGLAKEISKFNDLKSCKGSVYWMAPEVIHPKKTYGSAADIWSLGCTVLEMLTRQIPYPNVEWQHAFYRIGRGDQPPIPGHLSRDAQDFIRKCVSVDPSCRPTAAQLLEHPFVTRRALQTY